MRPVDLALVVLVAVGASSCQADDDRSHTTQSSVATEPSATIGSLPIAPPAHVGEANIDVATGERRAVQPSTELTSLLRGMEFRGALSALEQAGRATRRIDLKAGTVSLSADLRFDRANVKFQNGVVESIENF
jgi:hypothetical protein